MVSTRKKKQSNRRLLSQLDNFDQDIILGIAASRSQEKIVINESTNDRDFTAGIFSINSATNESTVNVESFERCLKERIDRERSNFVDTVEDRIQNAILTAIDNIVTPKIDLAIRSINASSEQDETSVSRNSQYREHVGIIDSFENASENNKIQQVSNRNDETRNNISDKVRQLSVPETRFDRQTHTHHMVTGQTAQTNQIPEFLTGCILTPRSPPSHQQQNVSTQVSRDNNLPMVEQTPRNQNLDKNNSINCLADTIAGIASQQGHKQLQC